MPHRNMQTAIPYGTPPKRWRSNGTPSLQGGGCLPSPERYRPTSTPPLSGIQEDMNVIADGGLVGIVTSVGSNWATVRSIIDDYSNVSAEISSTSDNCIIAGNLKLIDEGKISLVKLTDADNKVTVGDKVVTSEISNRFLPGILIGYVSEIGMDSNNLTKSGSITPVVDFRHLHEVLVITQLKNTDEAQKDIQSQAQSETEMILETETGKQTESSKQAGGEQ